MPHRFVRAVAPVVTHGLREMSVEGASLEHTLLQAALMGALIGTGVSPTQAVRQVEAAEAQLIGMHRGEIVEPAFHPGYAGAGAGMYGKPYGKGKMPYGQTISPYGAGAGFGTYGKGTTPYTTTPYMGGVRY